MADKTINIFRKYTPAELHNLIARNLDEPSQLMSALAVLCGYAHDMATRVESLEARCASLEGHLRDCLPEPPACDICRRPRHDPPCAPLPSA